MKKTLSLLILACATVAWSFGQDAPTVQVAPSDQIVYPDASQILNKTEPAQKPALASKAPVVAATPVPARPANGTATPSPTSAAPAAVPTHGWFLRWTIAGDESVVKAWAAALGRPVQIASLGPNQWEALAGPFTGDGLSQALAGQAGLVQLVKR